MNPDSKVHGTNMGPTWVVSAPDGPHVDPMSLAIRKVLHVFARLALLVLERDKWTDRQKQQAYPCGSLWFITTVWYNIFSMMTSSNGNIFRITGPLWGEFTYPGEFPAQRPVTRSFDVFFDLRLNKRLSKQPWGWWFETPSCPLWRHCNALAIYRKPPRWSLIDITFHHNFLTFVEVEKKLMLQPVLEIMFDWLWWSIY